MKVIFLDNDGVICLANNWGSRKKKRLNAVKKGIISDQIPYYDLPVEYRFDNFDEKAVKVLDRKSTRLNSSHIPLSRMPSSA